ncbi:MAG: LLM class flavin-dependent oxidoreductase, partial [Acidimicrobiia bacterium]|nr:LLM class flavin-dependent oxidoreductase [Acidimicrobiia bacterium]
MPFLTMRHDFRAPIDGSSTLAEIYSAAMDQFRWADEHGFDFGVVSEHHAFEDGWLPTPITVAAAVVGATKRLPVLLSAVILPLHDPIRIAEQLVVLDHLSRGRVWTVAGAGYRPEEFEMAGVNIKRRGAILESHLEVMLQAFTGEPFEYEGRTVQVTPRGFTDPHPPLFAGGGVEVAARRAARLRLPMMPMNSDPRLVEWYDDEAK